MIPKDGGNAFRGTVIADWTNSSLQGRQLQRRVRRLRVSASVNRVDSLWDAAFGFGGPLKKDTLWFYASTFLQLPAQLPRGRVLRSESHEFTFEQDPSRPAPDDTGIASTAHDAPGSHTKEQADDVFRLSGSLCVSLVHGHPDCSRGLDDSRRHDELPGSGPLVVDADEQAPAGSRSHGLQFHLRDAATGRNRLHDVFRQGSGRWLYRAASSNPGTTS